MFLFFVSLYGAVVFIKRAFTGLLLLLFSNYSLADSFNLSKPIEVKAQLGDETKSLRSYFSDRPEFSYYEEQSLGAASSVFLYGLDQRYVEITLNGFKVVDPSTPLGVLNLSQISGVQGVGVERYRLNQTINIKTEEEGDKSKWNIRGSQLGEYGASVTIVKDKWQIKMGGLRAGGYNQTSLGDEIDWTDDQHLAFDFKNRFDKFLLKSHLFYSKQDQDYDSIFNNVENAEGESHFLLIGQKIELKNLEIKLSYTLSDKTFKENQDKTSFRGESVNSEVVYRKWLSLHLWSEFNNDIDDQSIKIEVKPQKSLKASFMWSKLRDYFFLLEWSPLKEASFYYKEIPVSLFQLNYDPSVSLKPQKALGLKFYKNFNIKNVDLRVDGLYQRAFEQVEFVVPEMTYQNFERAETVYLSVTAAYKEYSLFVQGQRAKNLVQDTSLPRRPKWVLGFDYENRFKKIDLSLSLKWNSSLIAFDRTELSSFWTSSLNAKYKRFRFVVMNVLNQDKPIFRDFRRRPVTFELQYGYAF